MTALLKTKVTNQYSEMKGFDAQPVLCSPIGKRQWNYHLELTLYPPFNIGPLLLRNEIPLTARAPENHGNMIDF